MSAPQFPSALDIGVDRNNEGVQSHARVPFSPVVAAPGGSFRAITLTGIGPGASGIWRNSDFEVLVSGFQQRGCGTGTEESS